MTTVAVPVKLGHDFNTILGWMPVDHSQLNFPSIEVLKKPAIGANGWDSFGRERINFSHLIVPGSSQKVAIFLTDDDHPVEFWLNLKNFMRNPHYEHPSD